MVVAGVAWGEGRWWGGGGVAVGWLSSHLVVSGWAAFSSAFSNIKCRMSACFSPGFSNGDGKTGDDEADRGGDWGEDSDKMFERGGRQTRRDGPASTSYTISATLCSFLGFP
jgi:hypothetical protein